MEESQRILNEELEALRGKVMLITGGGSGLGRDVALQAGARGAHLALLDVRADRLEAVKAELAKVNAQCQTVPADVSLEEDVVAAVGKVVRRWGRLDIVVNSAGIYRGGLLVDTSMDDFDLVFRVNVRGTFLVAREAAKVMIRQGSGHIINVASIGAKHVFPREIAYAASKWAVLGINEGRSAELGPFGVRVTAVCPGGMNTTFWDEIRPTRPDWDPSRMLSSARVAQSIVQIASLPPDVVVKEALVYPPGR